MGREVTIRKSAVISEDDLYRHELTREWGATGTYTPFITFCMLNPSTADANVDDPTIRKCIGFTTRWGYQKFKVVNLFDYRATKPKELRDAQKEGIKICSKTNWEYIKDNFFRCNLIVLAWGAQANKWPRQAESVKNLALKIRKDVCALGFTKNKPGLPGQPSHPLMLSYDRKLLRVIDGEEYVRF